MTYTDNMNIMQMIEPKEHLVCCIFDREAFIHGLGIVGYAILFGAVFIAIVLAMAYFTENTLNSLV